MAFKIKSRETLICINLCIIVFCAVFGFIAVQSRSAKENLGVLAVKLMYEFDTIEDLNPQYERLHQVVSESAWEHLNINNDLRTINTYFKFRNRPSKVQIVYYRDGLLLYNLITDAVPHQTLWAFQYDIVDGKIDNVREYRLVSLYNGKEGGLIA